MRPILSLCVYVCVCVIWAHVENSSWAPQTHIHTHQLRESTQTPDRCMLGASLPLEQKTIIGGWVHPIQEKRAYDGNSSGAKEGNMPMHWTSKRLQVLFALFCSFQWSVKAIEQGLIYPRDQSLYVLVLYYTPNSHWFNSIQSKLTWGPYVSYRINVAHIGMTYEQNSEPDILVLWRRQEASFFISVWFCLSCFLQIFYISISAYL